MALHYLLPLHTLLFEGFFSSFHACAQSAAAHLASRRIFSSFNAFALSAAAAHNLVQKKRYLIHGSMGLAPQHKNQSSKALNPPPFQRLERDSSEMATSCCCCCCCWSIPTLPASSSCSPRISHHEKKHLHLELSLPKTRCDGQLAGSLAESTTTKKRKENEKKTRGATQEEEQRGLRGLQRTLVVGNCHPYGPWDPIYDPRKAFV
jgi:hypothetical protein